MWSVERDEHGRVTLPYFGPVKWHDREADTYARQFLIDHQPVGAPWRLTFKPPFYMENDRRACTGCRPGMPYSACEYALWAKAWQKKRDAARDSEVQGWR